MDKLNILILGDGLLGSEINKQTGWNYLSRKKDNFNISDINSWNFIGYNTIINCIANTDTYSNDRENHWNVNYVFVNNLINYCNDNSIKLIHISTDYIYSGSIDNASEEDVPVHCQNWYGYTKLLADGLVQLNSKDYLLIRCTHKPTPFQYEKAWVDQVGNFDYIDIISTLIINLINNDAIGLYNVGTDIKSILTMAKKTKDDVQPALCPIETPKNLTMNISKLTNFLDNIKKPFFSIAIPTYGYNGNGKEFLEFSFRKLEHQIFKDFEIVISDHSTDDTIKNLCDNWSSKLQIKYIRNDIGRGIISPNINSAMKNCNGEWIKILFQDDFLYDIFSLMRTKSFIDSNPDTNWLATKFFLSNDGINMYRLYEPKWNDLIWNGNNTIGCPSGITIRNQDSIFFDENLNWLMDVDFYKRFADKYGEPKILNEITVVNRTWGNRLTDTINEETKIKELKITTSKYA